MGKSSLPKVHRYSMHFKATAVRLSELPDVLIQDVAKARDIQGNRQCFYGVLLPLHENGSDTRACI